MAIVSCRPLLDNSTDVVSANNGTDTSISYVTEGPYRKCAHWTNNSTYTSKIAVTALGSGTLSIAMRAKKDNTGNYGRLFGNAAGSRYIGQLYGNNTMYSNINGSTTVSYSMTDNTNWHHYVWVFSSPNLITYYDGIQLNSTNAGTGASFGLIDYIGKYSTTNNSANMRRGKMTRIITHDAVVTVSYVKNNYAFAKGFF